MKKFTIDYIKNFIEENDKEHWCELLSTEYIDINTPLHLRCNICGKEFDRPFKYIKLNRFRCPKCAQEKVASNNRLSIEYVKNYLKENDKNHQCTLLSTEYKNINEPLQLKCNVCGKNFNRTFDAIRRAKNYACAECIISVLPRTLRHSKEEVQKIIWEERQYTMIGEYINASTKVKCKCSKGHEFNLIFAQYRYGNHSGCKKCANIKARGEKWENIDKFYNFSKILRDKLRPWRKKCLENAKYKCDITGSTDNLEVHHLINFSTLRDQIASEMNLDTENLTPELIDNFASELVKRHTLDSGVVLCKDAHKKFHELYGKENNTKEQYLQFKENYYK